jgi:hypothetical protein
MTDTAAHSGVVFLCAVMFGVSTSGCVLSTLRVAAEYALLFFLWA